MVGFILGAVLMFVFMFMTINADDGNGGAQDIPEANLTHNTAPT